MDFLKSAVASAISKGPAFPYSFGDRVDIDQSIWTLHNGTKREDSSKCSIFSFDVTANKSRLPLARNALRKLRTLRHPGVIKVLDTVETETYIYIATERLTPLGWHSRRQSLSEETVKWGLYNVAKTIKFINTEASSVHGALRVSSIFLSESGEWKVGGFDVLSSMNDDEAVIYSFGSLVPDSARYCPPEIVKGGWDAIKRNPLPAVDAFDFGVLIFEAFNGSFLGGDQVGQTKNVPPSMHQSYKRLINANPKARLSVGQFLEQGQRSGGFFETPLIALTEGIESLGLKSDEEREEFLSQLDELSDDFPEEFFKMKVLPELLKSVEFGGGGPKVFNVVIKISKKLSEDEYDAKITPVIVRLFTLPDRAIRVCLLDNLPLMVDHLSQKIVTDKIFPQMVTGFSDTSPVLREQTVKAVLAIITKLSDRIVNGELLRHLAKTANDEQPGIRTNTTICLGKIARNLGTSTRTKVLTAAFSRALRDPFVPARNAALMALAATADLYSEEDCASKLLPAICPSLVDKEKPVRDQANKCLDLYLARVRKYSQTLPETMLPPPNATGADGKAAPNISRVLSPQQFDTAGWTGWAISSFANKLASASGEMSSAATNGLGNEQRSQSVPPKAEVIRPTPAEKKAPTSQQSSRPTSSLANPVQQETFDSGWGDDWNNDDKKDDDLAAAWGNEEDDPWAEPKKQEAPAANFDDQGEPDFAGWLQAQSKSKQNLKKPLPKGLAKPSASRPTALKSNSTGTSTTTVKKAPVVQNKPKPASSAPKVTKKQAEEEEEGWGDAW